MQCTNNTPEGYKMTDTEKEEKKFKYFVSYFLITGSGEKGFENVQVNANTEIFSLDNIRFIEDEINKNHPGQKSVVISFQKFPN